MEYKGEKMVSHEEEKELKKELAKYKRKVSELAGVVHDIVEDSIWIHYVKLPKLSEDINIAMQKVIEFQEKHPFLK
jgi:NADH:ubiquinone oxidoreductase subunit E